MKNIFIYNLLLILISCNRISEKDKTHLEIMIELHNKSALFDWRHDSAQENKKLRINEVINGRKDLSIETEMNTFRINWNKPYDIKKDYELTIDKYFDYCQAHNYDPMKYISFINP